MVKTKCNECGVVLMRSPSRVEPRNYCSRECYSSVRNREIITRGKPHRLSATRSGAFEKHRISALQSKTSGDKHYSWKGSDVSYRGLHYWIRRKLGNPIKCIKCKKTSVKPRIIQWANTDGKYRRILSDYIPLCVSCHKIHDLKIK